MGREKTPASQQIPQVARIYADALLELAMEQGSFDQIATEIAALSDVIHADSEWLQILANPGIDYQARRDLLTASCQQLHCSSLLVNWLQILLQANRISYLPIMLLVYQQSQNQMAGLVTVIISSAVELTAKQRARLQQTLADHEIGTTNIIWQVDSQLLSGFRIQIDNRVCDISLAQDLDNLIQRIKAESAVA